MTQPVAGSHATVTGTVRSPMSLAESVYVIRTNELGDAKVFGYESEAVAWVPGSSLTPVESIEFQLEMPNNDTVVFRITGHSDLSTALGALSLAGTYDVRSALYRAHGGVGDFDPLIDIHDYVYTGDDE